jgi:succinate dehydrogenase/fumarate reductase flavoprotein subunit
MRAADRTGDGRGGARATLELVTDVLIIGGGPAGAWAALAARAAGCEVVLVDKGYCGTSGATAPSNTETWCVAPGEGRRRAVAAHHKRNGGWSDTEHVDRVLDAAWRGLQDLVDRRYPFPRQEDGSPYLRNLRGPDYMRFLRRRVIGAGVKVLDHHPALELLGDDIGVCGAAGIDRQLGNRWQARASAVVLATGGCAFAERFLGATGLTGDGYLMAVEAGAALSGMEMSSQYGVVLAGSSLNKGMPFRWARFFDCNGRELGEAGDDRQTVVAHALREGPVYASLERAAPQVQDWLRRGQPNCMLPFDRSGIDPFSERFAVGLRCEGTVRGGGGVRLTGADCATGVDGLYAAGDAASREDLVGALTGGGGPNSSWAIASGGWSGRAAALYALRNRRRRDARFPSGLGGAGLDRGQSRARRAASAPLPAEVVGAVRAEMLPLDRNFFRSGAGLTASLARLDEVWKASFARPAGLSAGVTPTDTLKAREAAALLASARWSVTAALARAESRGMHRRTDHPAPDSAAPRRLVLTGIDSVRITRVAGEAEATA